MQHILTNTNQVRFHRLDLFDNPVCDDELCVDVDADTETPLKLKWTK